MDIAAGSITIVKSAWTFYTVCKNIVKDAKNSEQRIQDRQDKVNRIRTVIEEIKKACCLDATDSGANVDPEEEELRKKIQEILSSCGDDLDALDAEIEKLRPQNGARVYHCHRNRKDLQQNRDEIIQGVSVFVRECMQSQGVSEPDSSPVEGDSQSKLPDPHSKGIEALGGADVGNLSELKRQSSSSLQARPLEFIQQFLSYIASDQNSLHLLLVQLLAFSNASNHNKGSPSDANTYADDVSSIRKSDGSDKAGSEQVKLPQDWLALPGRIRTYSPGPRSDRPSTRRSTTEPMRTTSPSPEILCDSPTSGDVRKCGTGAEDAEQLSGENIQIGKNKDKGNKLLELIEKNADEELDVILRDDVSLEEKDSKGKTPLLLATRQGKSEVVQKLLSRGANPHAVDDQQATALHIAVERCQRPVMSLILDHLLQLSTNNGKDTGVNAVDKKGRTPLHYCTWYGCAEPTMRDAAEELIASKADINALDKPKKPPVYYAVKNGRYTIVELFLQHGAKTDFDRPLNMRADIRELLEEYEREQASAT